MTRFLLLILLLSCNGQIFSQIEFSEHIISTNADDARSVYALDLDDDGDLDVMSASFEDDKIAWYENLNGLGDFGNEQVISLNADGAGSVFSADMDGDGDNDVISASMNDNKVAWYRNLDGLGTFGEEQIITSTLNEAIAVFVADLDGDGDMDVLSASYLNNKVVWFQNTDSEGTFGEEIIISVHTDAPWNVHAADIDGDGDNDVISTSFDDSKVVWYENEGDGVFSSEISISDPGNVVSPTQAITVDMDGDGDLDVVASDASAGGMEWWENTNGQGDFEWHWIPQSVIFPYSIATMDIDLDGDKDIVIPSMEDDFIAWYENDDGMGTFHSDRAYITENTIGAFSVFAADIDGDGVSDILSGSRYDDKIAWYRNPLTLGTESFDSINFLMSPVPTKDVINILSETRISKVEIRNTLGQLIESKSNSTTLDVSSLTSGNYFVSIHTEVGDVVTKRIVIE
ncbi:T9SS type A sorting domain-containing protein [Aureisphaera galaxeae]|uniref:T9SS type A sorting domain-containing protein n=1 Tax=Aureisphaera galaxeae TaxID=1538023 RepID=UPI00234FD710|nr:T9SS type A sorting domain-containing protein [Aureisphaera galaxeae]MDC8004809.1 T9SS type A sorting domain-containing protein [Aureisphaera galaxeae]